VPQPTPYGVRLAEIQDPWQTGQFTVTKRRFSGGRRQQTGQFTVTKRRFSGGRRQQTGQFTVTKRL
jgi:hypothetical protein